MLGQTLPQRRWRSGDLIDRSDNRGLLGGRFAWFELTCVTSACTPNVPEDVVLPLPLAGDGAATMVVLPLPLAGDGAVTMVAL